MYRLYHSISITRLRRHHFDYTCNLLPFGIVVELSSIDTYRNLAADYPLSVALRI